MGIVVASFIGFVGIVATFVITRWYSRTRKYLSFYCSMWPLIEHEIGNELQLYYKGEQIEDASIVRVALDYKGNEPLRIEDYEQPLSFEFDADIKVYSADIVSKRPKKLNSSASVESDNEVEVGRTLFNSGDGFTIQMLTSKCNSAPSVTARIAGIGEIRDAKSPTLFEKGFIKFVETVEPVAWRFLLSCMALLGGSFYLMFRFSSPTGEVLLSPLPAFALVFFTVLIFLLIVFASATLLIRGTIRESGSEESKQE